MKQFGILAVVAVALLVGGSWWSGVASSNDPSVVSKNGIHWHPQLAIYIKGVEQDIPQNIGLGTTHSSIHTHDDLPAIHLEFNGVVKNEDTRLGNFFDVWGKTFNANQILDYKNGPEGTVHMFVNGKENTEFENYHMRDGDKIEIRYE